MKYEQKARLCFLLIFRRSFSFSSGKKIHSYLVILVGRDRDEGSLGENVRAEGRVFGAESVILVGFDDVDPRLILVHRVQYDL